MNATAHTFPVTTTLQITEKRIADLLCGAFEGGSNYWVHEATVHDLVKDGQPWGPSEYTPSYIRAPFSAGGYVDLDPGEGEPIVRLDREALARGLKVMAEKYPRHWSDFLQENEDADTADCFLQCCLFGEIIFG